MNSIVGEEIFPFIFTLIPRKGSLCSQGRIIRSLSRASRKARAESAASGPENGPN